MIDQEIDQGVDQNQKYSQILEFCKIPKSARELANEFNYSNFRYFKRIYIKPLIEAGKISMTIPETPTSKNQKYITKEF